MTDFLGVDYLALLDEARYAWSRFRAVVVARGGASRHRVMGGVHRQRVDHAMVDEVERRRAGLGPEAPSDILFTSGTTGAPKGVVQTHGRTLQVATDWVAMTGITADDRYLMVNPYFHMFGFKAGILASVAAGAAMFPEAVFDVERTFRRVADERVTVLPGPPTLYQALLDSPHRAGTDLSSLRVAVTGAADIPVNWSVG